MIPLRATSPCLDMELIINDMERKIGEVFECDGKRLQVIEDLIATCSGCYFVNETNCIDRLDIRGRCNSKKREDGHNVAFKEIIDMNEENKQTILDEAKAIVEGSRQADYGSPVEGFELIAKLASLITGKDLTPDDCCSVLIAVKLSRETFNHKRDNLVDLCGYAYILNEIKDSKDKGE